MADIDASGRVRPQRFGAALCAAGLTLSFLEYWLLNYCAFPLFDTVFIWARELSAVTGGLVLAALALASYWRADMPDERLFSRGVPATMLAGMACVAAGVACPSRLLVALGAFLATAGAGLSNAYVGLACTRLGLARAAACVSAAYAASFALRWLVGALPTQASLALFALAPVMAVLLVRPDARALFARTLPESPAQMSVTSPHAFLPFSHQVFVTLVVFRVVYGFTLVFGEVDRVPVNAPWALVPLAVLALAAGVQALATGRGAGIRGVDTADAPGAGERPAHGGVARRALRLLSPDTLFKLSVLSTVAGFLLASLGGVAGNVPAQTLLTTGTGFFEVLLYYTLIALGTKSPAGALPALAWGNAVASWGTIAGAALGRAANAAGADELARLCALVVLGMVAYVLFALPRLSFAAAIEGVRGADVAVAGTPDLSRDEGAAGELDERCRRLAARAGLTERELEVLRLLARGRNARFIQEELAISYSTTKTHVSRIYRKLGVHAHQELIDVVEREG